MVCVSTSLLTYEMLKYSINLPPLNPDVEAVPFSHDSLGRGGGGDEGGGRGSCPGTPEMRRRQEEALKRLAGQVRSPCDLMYIYHITQ